MKRSVVTVQLGHDTPVDIRLDRGSGVALHVQLAEQLKHYIATRRISQGSELPSVRAFSSLLGLSPVTVSRAIAELRARGLVETRMGSGTFVVDFTAQGHEPSAGRKHLREFAQAVASQALRVGHDLHELAVSIEEIAESLSARDPRLLAIVDEFDSVDHLVAQLSAALADDGITVRGVRLDEAEQLNDLVARAGLVVSAPHCYGLVRQRLPDRAGEIVGLTMTLSATANRSLRSIDPSSRVIVVGTQQSFLSWMSNLVRLQVPLEHDPIEVTMADPTVLQEALDLADVVIFGSGVRHRLPAHIPPAKTVIELSHVPDAESISNLRARMRAVAGDSMRTTH